MSTLNSTYHTLVGTDAIIRNLKAQKMPVPESEDAQVDLSLRLAAYRSQSDLAAHVINMTDGDITSSDLDQLIKVAFPAAKTDKGRHGAYYLSKARTGQLKGCTVDGSMIAKANPKTRLEGMTHTIESLQARVNVLEAFILMSDLIVPE